jgi:predicted ABC-type exoprotein transport system permease subunit
MRNHADTIFLLCREETIYIWASRSINISFIIDIITYADIVVAIAFDSNASSKEPKFTLLVAIVKSDEFALDCAMCNPFRYGFSVDVN